MPQRLPTIKLHIADFKLTHYRLATDAQLVVVVAVVVDHRLALGNRPALPSAPAKTSFSSASSPIFACRVFTSTAGAASAVAADPKTAEAPSRSWERHCVIWFG